MNNINYSRILQLVRDERGYSNQMEYIESSQTMLDELHNLMRNHVAHRTEARHLAGAYKCILFSIFIDDEHGIRTWRAMARMDVEDAAKFAGQMGARVA